MQAYQDGERRTINGVTYVRQGGAWQPQASGPVYGPGPKPKDPVEAEKDQLGVEKLRQDIAVAPLEVQSKQQNIQQGQVSMADTTFDNKAKLRNDFASDKAVQHYNTALGEFGKMMRAPDNAQGDLAVIYGFAKAMDPGSVVREGEMGMATSTASLPQQLQAWAGQLNAGKRLPPEVRKGLIETARNAVGGFNQTYSLKRKEFTELARRYGFDPAEIIGDHTGDAFRPQEEAFLGRNVVGPEDAQQRSVVRPGDIGFNQEATPDPLRPEQEAAYDAFFKLNPNPTPDQLRAFGHSIGVTINNAEDIIEAKRQGAGVKSGSEAVYKAPDVSETRRGDEIVDPLLRGTADVLTMGFSEELAAVPRALSTGTSYGEALNYENAVRDYDKENNPYLRLGGQFGGGLALPTFGARTIPQFMGVGAGYGAAYGSGSADGNVMQRGVNALIGAGAGAGTAAALGGAGELARRGAVAVGRRIAGPTTAEQNALLRAGAEEQVPTNIGDLYPGAQNTISTLETIPGSSGAIRSGIKAGRDALEARVGDLGRGGQARENMGETVRDAGRRFVDRANDQAGRLYDRARKLAGDAPITPNNAKAVTKALLQAEEAVPGGTKAGVIIKKYADALGSGKPITIDGARAMRSELLSVLRTDGGLSKAKATHITNQIMRAVNQDIETSLAAAGRSGAVQAYRAADRFYAETREEIERITEKFIGTDAAPRSAEQTISAMRNAASPKGGNAKALGGMLARLSPDERKDYAATLVEHLGRKSPDEPFSPHTFVTQIRQLSPQARRIIFGEAGERSIQNLITLANAKNASVQRLNNSRSGQVINYRSVLSNIVFGIPGGAAIAGAVGGVVGAVGTAIGTGLSVAGIAGSRALAKALMNDEFTRAIAQAPATTSPKAINAHVSRLRKIGAKDPNVRTVVQSLEERLLKIANDNTATSRAAASEAEDRD